jgi:two-component system chemotaxis response regulator CheY
VLIVDDSKVMRMIVIRALRQSGIGEIEIVEAEDGVEGLAAAEGFNPDLVLSDWNMPNMSGLDFLKNFRAAANTAAFGFITSETHPATKDQALEAGAQFLLTKPFSPEQFAEIIGAAVA